MQHFQLVKKSSNSKTGAIPVTSSPRSTCPPSCAYKGEGGCYAEAGYYTRLNWNKLDSGDRGMPWSEFIESITKLPEGILWRHNISGDLRGKDDKIDKHSLRQLTDANSGKPGFTYTHYPITDKHNRDAVLDANNNGFTVNVSADSINDAIDIVKAYKLPTVAVAHSDYAIKSQVIDGVKLVQCPATYLEDVTCKSCKLCSVSDRDCVVVFPAHGSRKKAASAISNIEIIATSA